MIDGGNATCFVYGQTGSGKTYTIYGNREQNVDGLTKHLLTEIIKLTDEAFGGSVKVFVSLFEIYGSKIHDLLNEKNVLKMLEDSSGKSQIKGLKEFEVKSLDEAIGLLFNGICFRSVGKTSCNENSSRSHAVMQITLKSV